MLRLTFFIVLFLMSTSFSQGTEWVIYDTTNSGLPDNRILANSIEQNGNKWFCMAFNGLVIFDGVNWTVYNSANSGLPSGAIYSISIDQSANKWLGTLGGLVKYDGTNWTVFNTINSGLPNNYVRSIEFENNGNAWIATHRGGLAVYKQGGVVSVEEFYQNNFRSPND